MPTRSERGQPVALTVAGSDPSGGAGLQADLRAFQFLGVYGMAVPALLTVQSSRKVHRVEVLDAALVRAQLEVVLEDRTPHAAKTGALGNADVIATVADCLTNTSFPLVVDPVLVSSSGAPLLAEAALHQLRTHLIPRATLLTPNLAEAERLARRPVRTRAEMAEAARVLVGLGAQAVLVKGGHRTGDALDVLVFEGSVHEWPAPRIDTRCSHGTGCLLSALLTAHLAQGRTILEALGRAKKTLHQALETSRRPDAEAGPIFLREEHGS